MAYHSTSSKSYIPIINSINKPKYTSKYQNQIDNKLDEILASDNFVYDPESHETKQQNCMLFQGAEWSPNITQCTFRNFVGMNDIRMEIYKRKR